MPCTSIGGHALHLAIGLAVSATEHNSGNERRGRRHQSFRHACHSVIPHLPDIEGSKFRKVEAAIYLCHQNSPPTTSTIMSRPSYHHASEGDDSEDDQHSISLNLDDKELFIDETTTTPTHSKIKLYLTILLLVVSIALLAFLNQFLPSHSNPSTSAPNLDLEDCGLSPTSALQSNCIFDPILMGWVPLRCHDTELAAEFLSRQELGRFYRDEDHNSTMPLEEVMKGEWEYVYVGWEFQALHCMYSWKKTLRAAVAMMDGREGKGAVLDGYVGDEHHTNHCEMWMLQQGKEGIKELGVYMKYVGCPREGGGKKEMGRLGWYRVLGGKRVYRNE